MTLISDSPDSRTSDKPTLVQRLPQLSRADLWFCLASLSLAIFVTARLWIEGENAQLTTPATPDHNQFQWFFAHSVYVLTAFGDPFVSTRLNAPDGVNMMGNGSMLGIGIPLAPITIVFGPIYTFALATTLGLAGTAIAWYFLFTRRMHITSWAAAAGAGVCGFGPAMVSHADGHPSFVVAFMIPVIVWRVFALADDDRVWRNGIILGLCTAYQVFIGEESLFLTAVTCGIFFATYTALSWKRAQSLAKRFLTGLAIAAGTSVTLLAYPLWVQFFGPQHYSDLPLGYNWGGVDILSYFAFPEYSVGGDPGRTRQLMAVSPEENTFLGWPLIALAIAGAVWMWRSLMVRALTITASICFVLSLGPELRLRDQFYSDIVLPGRLLTKVPVFDHVIPARYGMVVMTIIGVLVALMVHRALTERVVTESTQVPTARTSPGATTRTALPQWGWCVAVVAALVPLFPTPLPVEARTPTPTFISSGMWRDYVGPQDTLMPVPLPSWDTDPMRWAAEEMQEFALPRGYFHGPYEKTKRSNFT
ncbi:MAG: glycosyl transferase, partial [Corynebacteriales bacterium]|nr:glycosyl transferase [Mycobacteriales bacterium]